MSSDATTKTPNRPRLGRTLGACAVAALALSLPSAGAETDPRLAPIPTLDIGTDEKAMVVELHFDGRRTVELQSASVAERRAHTHLGDPPLLLVDLIDTGGAVYDRFDAWHPLWSFVEGPPDASGDPTESMIVAEQASGALIFPFAPALRSIRLTDFGLDEVVAEIEVRRAIVDYCLTRPEDPDCRQAYQAMELGVDDPTVFEGALPTPTARFTVSLSEPVGVELAVAYTTDDGTALAPDDYDAVTGHLTIPAGATEGVIEIPVHDDTEPEGDETFVIHLTSTSTGTITDAEGRATIVDDDLGPGVLEIPTLTESALALLTLLLAFGGASLLRR